MQSHDYIAMERLYELHSSGGYDLIVVDTPPTRNAIDFLEAPARMGEFFGGRLLRWLTMPYRVSGGRGARMINVASRPFYSLADRVLGSQFLQDIAEFFLNFESMYTGFVERAKAVETLLHDRRTTFAVVTTLEGAPLREAEIFCGELRDRGFHLGALVLNKTLPDYLLSTAKARPRRRCSDATRSRSPHGARRRRASCSPTRQAPRGCCARSATRSAATRSWPVGRRSCRPTWRACPTSSCACRTSTPTSPTSRAGAGRRAPVRPR